MRSKSTLDWGLTSTLEQVTTDLRRAGKPGRSISFVGRILKKGVLACLFIQANGGSGPRGRFSEYRLGPAGNSSSPSLFAVDLKILRGGLPSSPFRYARWVHNSTLATFPEAPR